MDEPPTIDPVAAARWARMPRSHSAWLHEEIGRRMATRLSWITLPVQQWVHWEPELGGLNGSELVGAQYPQAQCFEVRCVPPERTEPASGGGWLRRLGLRGHAARAPVTGPTPPEGQAQLVWANMQLHHSADPAGLMKAWGQALQVDGFLMFSCLGVDTLQEIRSLYEALGWPPPSEQFTDMHDWADQLFFASFTDPVVDMEHITLTFETPQRLLHELRELGRNLHPQRFAGLRTPRWRRRLEAELDARLRPSPGAPLELTFEVIYGHALKVERKLRRDVQAPAIDFNFNS